jgi:hypothetical protein
MEWIGATVSQWGPDKSVGFPINFFFIIIIIDTLTCSSFFSSSWNIVLCFFCVQGFYYNKILIMFLLIAGSSDGWSKFSSFHGPTLENCRFDQLEIETSGTKRARCRRLHKFLTLICLYRSTCLQVKSGQLHRRADGARMRFCAIAPSGWRSSNGGLHYCTVRPLGALWRLTAGVPSPFLTAGATLPLSDGWVYLLSRPLGALWRLTVTTMHHS